MNAKTARQTLGKREVKYAHAESMVALGKGGRVRLSGLELEAFELRNARTGDEIGAIAIRALTSRGKVSYNCLVEVPMPDVPALIEALQALHAEAMGGPEAGP